MWNTGNRKPEYILYMSCTQCHGSVQFPFSWSLVSSRFFFPCPFPFLLFTSLTFSSSLHSPPSSLSLPFLCLSVSLLCLPQIPPILSFQGQIQGLHKLWATITLFLFPVPSWEHIVQNLSIRNMWDDNKGIVKQEREFTDLCFSEGIVPTELGYG